MVLVLSTPKQAKKHLYLTASTASFVQSGILSVSSTNMKMIICQKFSSLSSRAKDVLDLEKHFAFYGAYHSNPTNVLIHTLFVWPILYTSLILFHFTTPLLKLPPWLGGDVLALNFAFILVAIFGLFYVIMDHKAGSFAAVLCILCWIGSGYLANRLGFSQSWKVVLAAQLFCWTGQFLGHGLFEKRAPALLDNFLQAILTAPFFVLLEVLKNMCGYEPYPGFHAAVKAKVENLRKEWEASKKIL